VTREDIEQLHRLMQFCFKHDGPYRLSSGIVSKYYYDGKLGTLHPPTAWLLGNIILDVIADLNSEAVGGLEVGAIPIADAVGIAAHLRGMYLPTFFVRKEAKTHGTKSRISQSRYDDAALLSPGRRVAIVDDVITTGESIQDAIDVVKSLGCVITTVIALVERHESGGKALRGEGFPVLPLFYTNEDGDLFINEEFVQSAGGPARRGVLSR
jgi:orotate phosphoribosyltransferase